MEPVGYFNPVFLAVTNDREQSAEYERSPELQTDSSYYTE